MPSIFSSVVQSSVNKISTKTLIFKKKKVEKKNVFTRRNSDE